jgi:hypothetical protein
MLKASAALAFARLVHGTGHVIAAQQILRTAAADPRLSEADRKDLAKQQSGWGGTGLPSLPGLSLDALLQRASAEAGAGHAPLVSALEDTNARRSH